MTLVSRLVTCRGRDVLGVANEDVVLDLSDGCIEIELGDGDRVCK
jgi:hypothetical protein